MTQKLIFQTMCWVALVPLYLPTTTMGLWPTWNSWIWMPSSRTQKLLWKRHAPPRPGFSSTANQPPPVRLNSYIFPPISLSLRWYFVTLFTPSHSQISIFRMFVLLTEAYTCFLRADNEENSVPRKLPNSGCDFVFYGNSTRSGHFDTRSTSGWPHEKGPAVCRLTFVGRKVDVVHVSLFNYDLRLVCLLSVACGRDLHRLKIVH